MANIYSFNSPYIEQNGISDLSTVNTETNIPYTQIHILKNVFGGTGVTEKRKLTAFGSDNKQSEILRKTTLDRSYSVTTQLQSSIGLPLPNGLDYNYRQDWSEDTVELSEQIVNAFVNRTGSSGQILDDYKLSLPGYSNISDMVNRKLINAVSNNWGKLAARKAGIASNPYKELFYNGTTFRTFSWSWDFAPINEKQSQEIEQFIHELEQASLPEYWGEQAGSPFKLPDTFEIEFVNTKLPKLKGLALTSIDKKYDNSGAGPKFFSNGHPSFISLSLSFIEITLITKKEHEELRNK